jgi:flagellar P-ring protein precursor FlgI
MRRVNKVFVWILTIGLLLPSISSADRIKDLASIQGVRNNQLIGYGLVVGLDGSGDMTTQTPFTVQSVISVVIGPLPQIAPKKHTALRMWQS